jgi:hypothetical protein
MSSKINQQKMQVKTKNINQYPHIKMAKIQVVMELNAGKDAENLISQTMVEMLKGTAPQN